MTSFGTSHFVDVVAARRYYARLGFNARDVDRKLAEGEIHLGAPAVKPGERLRVNSEERYVIEEVGPRCADCNQLLIDKFHTGVFFHVGECGKTV